MTITAQSIAPRALRALVPAAFFAALLVACAGDPARAKIESQSTYDRTFDTVVGAMADQKLVIGQQDRRLGSVVGHETGVVIAAEIRPRVDGVIEVRFEQTGPSASGPAVLQKVVESYESRMARLKLLPGSGSER